MNWAVFALRDIINALDKSRYDVAAQHIEDAIEAIIAQDEEDMKHPARCGNASRSVN